MTKRISASIITLCLLTTLPAPASIDDNRPSTIHRLFAPAAPQGTADPHSTESPYLRSYLEPGHSQPESAVSIRVSEDQPYKKTTFSYRGDTIRETTRQYPQSEYYIFTEIEEYAFDANRNKVWEYKAYESNGEIYWGRYYERAYNPNNTPLFERYYTRYDSHNTDWTLYYSIDLQYNDDGMMTGGTYYNGSTWPVTVSGTWANLEIIIGNADTLVQKSILSYDPATMLLLSDEAFYENENGLYSIGLYEYEYDDAGRLIKQVNSSGDRDGITTLTYTYDDAGRKASEIDVTTSMTGIIGYQTTKTEYEYAGDRLSRIINLSFFHTTNSYQPVAHTTFYYTDDAGIRSPLPSSAAIYAADGYIHLTLPQSPGTITLHLYNTSGHPVLTTNADPRHPIKAPLPAGIYIYSIQAGNDTYAGKLVVGG